jgi:lysophospholipase L1-like esterase
MLTDDHELRYLAWGDSYTIGEGVAASERWPIQLAELIRGRGVGLASPHIVARTGWTSADLAAEIDRANPQGPFALVTLLIGVNNQVQGRSPHEYRREFTGLLARAIGFAAGDQRAVIVLSIPDWGVTPYAEGQDRARIGREIDAFNAINREATLELGVHYVDITPLSRGAAGDLALLAADGLHPSGKLYAQWASLALPPACEALGVPK